MKRSPLVAACAAVLLLQSGCGHEIRGHGFRPATSPYVCPRGQPECKLTVNVAFDATTGKCEIGVSDDEVKVTRGEHPFVVWDLRQKNVAAGEEFRFVRATGIEIPRNDPTLDWDNGQSLANGQSYHWKSVNKQRSSLKYNVNIEHRAAATHGPWLACVPLDPQMTNDGG